MLDPVGGDASCLSARNEQDKRCPWRPIKPFNTGWLCWSSASCWMSTTGHQHWCRACDEAVCQDCGINPSWKFPRALRLSQKPLISQGGWNLAWPDTVNRVWHVLVFQRCNRPSLLTAKSHKIPFIFYDFKSNIIATLTYSIFSWLLSWIRRFVGIQTLLLNFSEYRSCGGIFSFESFKKSTNYHACAFRSGCFLPTPVRPCVSCVT